MSKRDVIDEMVTVGVPEYEKLVGHVMDTGGRLLVLGNPGIGKSQIVHKVAKQKGKKVYDIRLSQFVDGGDLIMKIPTNDNTEINEVVFNRLPKEAGSVLFLDEFPHADESVRKAMFELIHDRRLGPYELPEGVAIIAAGNEGRDMMSPDMESPLFDRFTFRVQLNADPVDWFEYIKDKPNGLLLMGYLKAFKDHFYEWPDHGRVLMTPRRWEAVGQNYPNDTLMKASMPPGIYSSFKEFSSKVEMFQHIESYLSGQKECPSSASDQWAVYTAAMSRLEQTPKADVMEFSLMILADKSRGLGAEIKSTLMLETLRATMRLTGRTTVDFMAKLAPKERAIVNNIVDKYKFAISGLQGAN